MLQTHAGPFGTVELPTITTRPHVSIPVDGFITHALIRETTHGFRVDFRLLDPENLDPNYFPTLHEAGQYVARQLQNELDSMKLAIEMAAGL